MFEAWSRQQDDAFRKRAAAALDLEAAKEQAQKKEMLLHFENDLLLRVLVVFDSVKFKFLESA